MTIFHLALDRANLTSSSFMFACHDCCRIPPAQSMYHLSLLLGI